MESQELNKALRELFKEIAEKEKKKAIRTSDYATAFVATIIGEMLKEAQ